MKKDIYILWISCFFHDSSISLMKNGEIVFAIEEEKITRVKHDHTFPENAILACLKHEGITIDDIDYIGFYEKPFIKFENFIKNYIQTWPLGYYGFIHWLKDWLQYKLHFSSILKKKTGYKGDIIYMNHHLSHAAGAFFSSGYHKSAVLTIDGVGEKSTTTWWIWEWIHLDIKENINFPHSIGLLYSTFTAYLGFEVNDWEYKMMWLAPYGKPMYTDLILKEIVELSTDGSFTINMNYFSYHLGRKMFNRKFEQLFWYTARQKNERLEQFHKDIAASIQEVVEKIVLQISSYIYNKTWIDSLCISWWVGLNCVLNYKILKLSRFKHIYVQPAPWDSWSSIWVCYYIYHCILGYKEKKHFSHIYLWSDFINDQDQNIIHLFSDQVTYEYIDNEAHLFDKIADLIYKNKVIGWYQWRTEFGPRALWNRSILWNPLEKKNWKRINLKIKFRESFRPFAPSLTQEFLSEHFDIQWSFPYMLFIAQVKNKKLFPAITHVDWTSRVQTVTKKSNERYYSLLKAFEKKSWYPILINTSFNLAWEPIVDSPKDALETFLACDMDYLVIWNYIIRKSRNNIALKI